MSDPLNECNNFLFARPCVSLGRVSLAPQCCLSRCLLSLCSWSLLPACLPACLAGCLHLPPVPSPRPHGTHLHANSSLCRPIPVDLTKPASAYKPSPLQDSALKFSPLQSSGLQFPVLQSFPLQPSPSTLPNHACLRHDEGRYYHTLPPHINYF